MEEERKHADLGSLLKALLKQKSLSMRKLSALTGIDTATISRIVNGKQTAKLYHLEQFAQHLGVPTELLLQAIGIKTGHVAKEEPTDIQSIQSSFNAIQEVLHSSAFMQTPFSMDLVEKELHSYEQYAQTEAGERLIREEFETKVKQVDGAGPFIDQLKEMYTRFVEGHVSPAERAILGSALLYFILSTDIIPDYVFPIGYLDDAIAVHLVLAKLQKYKGSE